MMRRIRQETHRQRSVREMRDITIGMIVLIGLITFCIWSICSKPVKHHINHDATQQWMEAQSYGRHWEGRK